MTCTPPNPHWLQCPTWFVLYVKDQEFLLNESSDLSQDLHPISL